MYVQPSRGHAAVCVRGTIVTSSEAQQPWKDKNTAQRLHLWKLTALHLAFVAVVTRTTRVSIGTAMLFAIYLPFEGVDCAASLNNIESCGLWSVLKEGKTSRLKVGRSSGGNLNQEEVLKPPILCEGIAAAGLQGVHTQRLHQPPFFFFFFSATDTLHHSNQSPLQHFLTALHCVACHNHSSSIAAMNTDLRSISSMVGTRCVNCTMSGFVRMWEWPQSVFFWPW